MGRPLIARALRLIVALCVGLAIVLAILTVVGLARGGVAQPAYIAAMAVGVVALLLALARLAYLALARIVDLGPPHEPRS